MESFCCSGADSGLSATAGRNVPTKPIGLEKWRCRGLWGFCGVFVCFLLFKGVERPGRETSQQCALEP